jgi:hypothetical protein
MATPVFIPQFNTSIGNAIVNSSLLTIKDTLEIPIYIGHPHVNSLANILDGIQDDESFEKLIGAWKHVAKNIENKTFAFQENIKVDILKVVIPIKFELINGKTICVIEWDTDEDNANKMRENSYPFFFYLKGEVEASQTPQKDFKLDFINFKELFLVENSQKSIETKLFDILSF